MTQTDAPTPWRPIGAYGLFFALLPAGAVGGGLLLPPTLALSAVLAVPLRAPPAAVRGFLLAVAPVALFALYAGASFLWTEVPPERQRPEQAFKIIGAVWVGLLFVAGALWLGPRGRAWLRAFGVAACLMLIMGLAIELFAGMPFNTAANAPGTDPGILERNPGKGTSILVAMWWGVLAACVGGARWEWTLWRGVFAATAALATQFGMLTNLVALAAGLGVYVLTYAAPRFGLILTAVGLALWVLICPFVMPVLAGADDFAAHLPLSWQMRVEIWEFTAARIMERPWFGWGLDAGRMFSGELLAIGDFKFEAIPLHPHSWPLHVWLEHGAVGAALLAAGIVSIGVAAANALARTPVLAAAAAGALATIGSIWCVSYGAWQEWWVAVPFAAAVFLAAGRR